MMTNSYKMHPCLRNFENYYNGDWDNFKVVFDHRVVENGVCDRCGEVVLDTLVRTSKVNEAGQTID